MLDRDAPALLCRARLASLLDLLGHIGRGAAIAEEDAGGIEARVAVDSKMEHLAVGADVTVGEVAEGPMRLEIGAVALPLGIVGVVRGPELEAGLAGEGCERPEATGDYIVGLGRETVLLAALPIPIRRDIGEILEPRLAFAQRLLGVRLLADIVQDRDDVGDLAGRVADRRDGGARDPGRAIRPSCHHFAAPHPTRGNGFRDPLV